jgi:predicted secreted protein
MKSRLYSIGILLLVILTGCVGLASKKEITIADSGKKITRKVGGRIDFLLTGNPSKQFEWVVTQMDPSMVRQEGSPKISHLTDPSGFQPMTEYRFSFSVFEPGQSLLELSYVNKRDRYEAPAEVFQLQIEGLK